MVDDAPDARDPRLAELLEVEPLDELTRRRLVASALEESAPPRAGRAWQVVAVAAAIVAVMTFGLVALLDGSDTGTVATNEQALRPRSSETADSAAGAASDAQSANPAPTATESTPAASPLQALPYAGDVGDLSARAARAKALDAVAGPPTDWTAARSAGDAATLDEDSQLALRDLSSCLDPILAIGRPVGYATGRFGDRPATVVVIERPDGKTVVRAVLSDPCEVREL